MVGASPRRKRFQLIEEQQTGSGRRCAGKQGPYLTMESEINEERLKREKKKKKKKLIVRIILTLETKKVLKDKHVRALKDCHAGSSYLLIYRFLAGANVLVEQLWPFHRNEVEFGATPLCTDDGGGGAGQRGLAASRRAVEESPAGQTARWDLRRPKRGKQREELRKERESARAEFAR